MTANSERQTVGYFPKSFPRDPLVVNTALEHMLLGQILEPLVSHDSEGNVIPGVAKSWRISQDGLTMTFFIDPHKRFSNGREITAEDVCYSINRHRTSSVSQSKEYLKNITEISAVSRDTVLLTLRKPQVSILKALSRSHLGILPSGWVFDPKALEPIIGSGKYSLLKTSSGSWILKLRKDFAKEDRLISEWEILFADDVPKELSGLPMADYVPLARADADQAIQSDHRSVEKGLRRSVRNTLAQTAAWWYPLGRSYGDRHLKTFKMGVMRDLLKRRRDALGYDAITGLIPKGIQGNLASETPFPAVPRWPEATPLHITVSAFARETAEIFTVSDTSEVERLYNVKFDLIPTSVTDLKKLAEKKPDIFVISWLGGFADPEGFLPVLTAMMGVDFEDYLADLRGSYKRASEELLWDSRASLFQNFNRKMVEEERFIPAWQPSFFSFISPALTESRILFRYTPDFTDVRFGE